MSRIDEFIHASELANAQRSNAQAVQHFEVERRGRYRFERPVFTATVTTH
jgi:hypothetical protein